MHSPIPCPPTVLLSVLCGLLCTTPAVTSPSRDDACSKQCAFSSSGSTLGSSSGIGCGTYTLQMKLTHTDGTCRIVSLVQCTPCGFDVSVSFWEGTSNTCSCTCFSWNDCYTGAGVNSGCFDARNCLSSAPGAPCSLGPAISETMPCSTAGTCAMTYSVWECNSNPNNGVTLAVTPSCSSCQWP